MKVTNYKELQLAIELNHSEIEISGSINMPSSVTLKKGMKLIGVSENAYLGFINSDGIILQGDNEVSNLIIQTNPNFRAISIDSSLEDLGTLTLSQLTVTGMVQLLTRDHNKYLTINAHHIDVVFADSRNYSERPMKYGVNVYQGAFTVYNFNSDSESRIVVNAENISVGRKNAPVLGSGILVSGFGDEGGQVIVEKLTTLDVFSNGMIPQGQPNLITGGVFIVYGVVAESIISNGVITTYGTNDMVLDVWGNVKHWIVNRDVISYGPSGIGFVNFGTVKYFESNAKIITFGLGARGFNQYDGTIETAIFNDVETFGDGAIGLQVSKPVGEITINGSLKTHGSVGKTLVKGVIMNLHADGISVLAGGEIKALTIYGNLSTFGDNVVSYHINGGKVDEAIVHGEIEAFGENSELIQIENEGNSKNPIVKG